MDYALLAWWTPLREQISKQDIIKWKEGVMATSKHIKKCREMLEMIAAMTSDFAEEYQKAVDEAKENPSAQAMVDLHSVGMITSTFNPGGEHSAHALIGHGTVCHGLVRQIVQSAADRDRLVEVPSGNDAEKFSSLMRKMFGR